MKIKHIFPALMAAIAMFTGCSVDNDPAFFDDLHVSSSYVGISDQGGSTQITLTAAAGWAFNADEIPAWLTVSPQNGDAGEATVTFSAEETLNGRSAALHITSGGLVQEINVIQGKSEPAEATCAEVIAGPDGKTFRVKGTITQIANTHYGNMYIADETGSVYIYGTNDKDGKKANDPIASWGLEQGDVVTVEGPKSTYKETVELVDVTVIAIEKSLIKNVSAAAESEVAKEGGDVEVKLAYKGIGVVPTIPAEATWIRLKSMELTTGTATAVDPNPADTAVVKFYVEPNTGASRKAEIQLASTDGNNTSSISYKISQEAFVLPHGFRAEDPFTASEAVAYVSSMAAGEKSLDNVYVKGKISSIKYTYSAQYGTATYNISDDGQEENVFTVYGSYFLEGKPWAEGDEQIEVGDEVLVCGKVVNYNGTTPEFSSKENWLVSIRKAGVAEAGSLENPFTAAQALEAAGKLENKATSEVDYYIKGKISSIKYTFSAQYGTAQFSISDNGSEEGDQFLIYGTYYLGNKPWVEGNTQIAVGDEVIICGKITNYNGTLETANKQNYIYSLNGKTE